MTPHRRQRRGNPVAVVGGANVDLVGSPAGKLLVGESNPGAIRVSAGGVGRNIAENLARLGVSTQLLSIVGHDMNGEAILESCRRCGIGTDHLAVVDGVTPMYLALLDGQGDLQAAVSQMDLLDRIDAAFVEDRATVIEEASLVVMDANLKRSAIEHLCHRYAGELPFFIDTVSAAKAQRLQGLIGAAHTIKPNRAETEVLLGMTIDDRGDLNTALTRFLDLGVERVVISLGDEGLFFGDARSSGFLPSVETEVVDTTGSGDAAMAALAYAYLEGRPWTDSVRFAMAASVLTLSQERAVHPELSVERVERLMGRKPIPAPPRLPRSGH